MLRNSSASISTRLYDAIVRQLVWGMLAATVASRPATAAACGSTVLSRRRRDATEVRFLIGYSIERLLRISLAVWGFVAALCAADV
jgi:hypothetical protein